MSASQQVTGLFEEKVGKGCTSTTRDAYTGVMENTQTAQTTSTKATTYNGIDIYRSNFCRNTQARTNKNPMAWVFHDIGHSVSFKTLKAAKSAIDFSAAKYEGYATTDFKGNFFAHRALDGKFAVVSITHEEWKELRRSLKAGA